MSAAIDSDQLRLLLQNVASGTVSPEEAAAKLKFAPFEQVGDFARIDHQRPMRNGIPEAVWGPGKTPEQISQILQNLHDRGSVAMATRIEPEICDRLRLDLPQLEYAATARIAHLPQPAKPQYPGTIGVITAGTSDLPVAEEAAVTAELCGATVERLWDVGVAGIHRLLHNRDILTRSDVLIVVAGMEGALASVVAGLADCPVVAVPTSVGYGASFGGVAALLTMLNSCAAGVGVLNIDNGFGAAILALQILRTAANLAKTL
ncbi:nickel pincer cofactor biosynthesis protein LarB [Synechococcus sp. PCC 7336]|uniref:nickel pincer cofactor biosynthesis protein LarB n=1 Tax=Synechococcus sp. PCC 7336 TaxID=195250 RepID=UPI000345254A|nr:nickel pincer cofactor biosynthesis protein LarB [Synechococcus sp. PCC 7336]